jgi:hypothetical protein
MSVPESEDPNLDEIYVPMSSSLKKDILIKKVCDLIDKKLRKIPDLLTRRNDEEITELVCNVIENYCKAKRYKVDKKDVVKVFLQKLFNLNADELKKLDRQIEFIHGRNLIKKIPYSKYIKRGAYNLLKKII